MAARVRIKPILNPARARARCDRTVDSFGEDFLGVRVAVELEDQYVFKVYSH